ncbi:conserved unknown protein [Ectocarpus siliculosus]|uniref:RING-type domain-containing protein n=1 Tax=Ectocarpus siliculosus TaxID=2880 RepID=D7G5M0_ECTSI|nr:conserved unknown protein [Ectocarpus siliculosus]|eukprot:CBJ33866.1 conserved unknown protein [Ectocarpus siliculosus]
MMISALNLNRSKRGVRSSVVELPAAASDASSPQGTPQAQIQSGGSSSGDGSAHHTGAASSGPSRVPWRRPRSLLRLPGSAASRRQRTTVEVLPDPPRGRRTTSPSPQPGSRPAPSVLPTTRQYGRPSAQAVPRVPSRSPLLLTAGDDSSGSDRPAAQATGDRRPSRVVPSVIDLAGGNAVRAGASRSPSPESTNAVVRHVDEGMRDIERRRLAREATRRAREAERRLRDAQAGYDSEFDMDTPTPTLSQEQILRLQSLSPVVTDLTGSLTQWEFDMYTTTVLPSSEEDDTAALQYMLDLEREEEDKKKKKEEGEEEKEEQEEEEEKEEEEEEEEAKEEEEEEEDAKEEEEEEEEEEAKDEEGGGGGEDDAGFKDGRVKQKKKGKGKRKRKTSFKRKKYDDCAICLDSITPFEGRTTLPCGHVFHWVCAHTLLLNYSSQCPSCRKEVA